MSKDRGFTARLIISIFPPVSLVGFVAEKYVNFSVQKITYFCRGKILYFSLRKNQLFFCVEK